MQPRAVRRSIPVEHRHTWGVWIKISNLLAGQQNEIVKRREVFRLFLKAKHACAEIPAVETGIETIALLKDDGCLRGHICFLCIHFQSELQATLVFVRTLVNKISSGSVRDESFGLCR